MQFLNIYTGIEESIIIFHILLWNVIPLKHFQFLGRIVYHNHAHVIRVIHLASICIMDTSGSPDMYTRSPRAIGMRAEGEHIRKTTHTHVTNAIQHFQLHLWCSLYIAIVVFGYIFLVS